MNPQDQLSELTERQREVLRLFCDGLKYKVIGEQLFIAEPTVKTHMGNIYVKLGIDHLEPAKRKVFLVEKYCPLLKYAELSPAPPDEGAEPEPVPERVIKMVEEDERALVPWEPKLPMLIEPEWKEVKERPLLPWLLVFMLLGILLTLGIIYALGGFGRGGETLVEYVQVTREVVVEATAVPASPQPTQEVVTEEVPSPTPPATSTPYPTYTPRPTYTSQPTPRPPTKTPYPTSPPRPTRTPRPTPGGIGTGTGSGEFQVILTDYEFRTTANETDKGAAEFSIDFINNTGQEVEVVVNWLLVEGVDNLGIKYGEINSVGARHCAASAFGCFWGDPDASKLEVYTFVVAANSKIDYQIELQLEGYSDNDLTRVDIGTDWIDLTIPSIKYRTDELHEISAQWRLER